MFKKTILSLFMALLWVVSCWGQASQSNNLIPVGPSYEKASYNPQSDQNSMTPEAARSPTPREQMYVFWLLGKLISYPVDKAEEIIMNQISSLKNSPKSVPEQPVKAPNPFAGVTWREIPPAPPVSSARSNAGR